MGVSLLFSRTKRIKLVGRVTNLSTHIVLCIANAANQFKQPLRFSPHSSALVSLKCDFSHTVNPNWKSNRSRQTTQSNALLEITTTNMHPASNMQGGRKKQTTYPTIITSYYCPLMRLYFSLTFECKINFRILEV